jgi:hypothetical protein
MRPREIGFSVIEIFGLRIQKVSIWHLPLPLLGLARKPEMEKVAMAS